MSGTNGKRMTREHIENWFDYSLDLSHRRIFLTTVNFDSDGKEIGVETLMTEFFIKGLAVMQDSRKRVRVIMNNIGGDWFHGMAIYDAIRESRPPVDIEVYGHAMSMGAVILQAGERRYLHPNAAVMVHDGNIDEGGRPVQSARNWSNYEERNRRRMYEIFASRSGHPPSYWKRKCAHDYVMCAEEAVREGLADKILLPARQLSRVPRPKR